MAISISKKSRVHFYAQSVLCSFIVVPIRAARCSGMWRDICGGLPLKTLNIARMYTIFCSFRIASGGILSPGTAQLRSKKGCNLLRSRLLTLATKIACEESYLLIFLVMQHKFKQVCASLAPERHACAWCDTSIVADNPSYCTDCFFM